MSHHQPGPRPPTPIPRRWPALATLLLAGFMNLIDVTIVNVALPRLQASLGATSTEIEWVVAAYVLAFALGLLPFGRLGDIIGRKRMFLIGISLFTLFSALCGLAPSIDMLIGARVLQGLAGAMMMPQVLAIAQVMFPPRERGFAFSLFGLSAGLASVAGPLAGGLLIGADLFGLDWRPIFLVNIPVGILAVIAGRALVPALPPHPEPDGRFRRRRHRRPVDPAAGLPADRGAQLWLAGLDLRDDRRRPGRRGRRSTSMRSAATLPARASCCRSA